MADIIDYALLNAHKDFDTLPYSQIDCLIFSELAYLSFDNIVPNSRSRSKGLLFSVVIICAITKNITSWEFSCL